MLVKYLRCALLPGLLLTLAPSAQAARQAVLKIEVTVDGQKSWRDGNNWSNGTIKERFVTEAPMESDLDLESYNTLDPDYANQMMAFQAKADARRQKIEAMQAKRGGHAPPAGGNMMSVMMSDPQAMMAMQKKAEACKEDETCLRKIAMDMMASSGQMGSAMAQIQEVEALCSKHQGKAYEACLDKEGKARSRPPEGMQEEDIPELEEPEAKFRRYMPRAACGARGEAHIDHAAKGQMADVAGMYDTVETHKGGGPIKAAELERICLSTDLAVDEKARTLFPIAWMSPPVEVKTFIHNPPDAPIQGVGDLGASQGVAEWVTATLRNAPLSGSKSTTLNKSSGKVTEILNVTVKWSFTERR